MATGKSISALAIGVRCSSRLLSPRSALRHRDKASRSADQAGGPSDIRRLRFGAAHASAASAAGPLKNGADAAMSRI